MKTVKLDKEAIKDAMWDGCHGSHVLAVAPDGSDHRIHWLEDNRQWDPWPDGWLIISIPALDPDGEGSGAERAEEMILEKLSQELRKEGISEGKSFSEERHELLEQIRDACYETCISIVDFAEKAYPDDWAAWTEEAYDWLLDAFLSACNGCGDELNTLAPWGMTPDRETTEDPPAEFEWAAD